MRQWLAELFYGLAHWLHPIDRHTSLVIQDEYGVSRLNIEITGDAVIETYVVNLPKDWDFLHL
ncbi:hypothetical protein JRC04_05315 [Mycolicibacterium sp. S2-37]|uniref:hypothetical protein n=1 Tax=Mycolicibacterium sp. S2-37 TaxID=2810297 RepID=UPI001A94C3B5|nr:hypothetical protein [Mycolicibacterium sp. S2-37]MBO0676874.1 hypothetical protein [Mycolicibacterium sp. S2-37]